MATDTPMCYDCHAKTERKIIKFSAVFICPKCKQYVDKTGMPVRNANEAECGDTYEG